MCDTTVILSLFFVIKANVFGAEGILQFYNLLGAIFNDVYEEDGNYSGIILLNIDVLNC